MLLRVHFDSFVHVECIINFTVIINNHAENATNQTAVIPTGVLWHNIIMSISFSLCAIQ